MLAFSFEGYPELQKQLQVILQRSGTLEPLIREMGEDLVNFTKNRFVTSTDPDGNPWQPNRPVTLARKTNTLPLVDTGHLAQSVIYDPTDDGLWIGANADQAATMQFGAAQGQFGVNKRNAPIPWGNIPARPYLGLSESDIQHCLALSEAYFLADE